MQIPLAGASLPGTSRRFSPAPHPARACGREPIRFCRQPPPRPRLRRDTHTLLPASPTPPAPSALLPRPRRGAVAVLVISGEQPYPALLQDLPMLWTVWISPRGERLTGRGNLFPLPCLPHFNHLTSHRHPHPTRAFGAPPPPPLGAGQCPGVYQESSRIRGGAGGQPYLILLPSIPAHRIVVDIGIGGGGRERDPHPRGERGPCAFRIPAASNPRRKIVTKKDAGYFFRTSLTAVP